MKMQSKKSLFIIMPFGVKKGRLDHFSQDGNYIDIDFDKIWKSIIQPSIPEEYDYIRADELKRSGPIDRNYIELLINSEMVLADLTFGNANVYYELGMRHVLSRKGTVLIAQSGTKLPFDVRNQSVLYYDNFDATKLVDFQQGLKDYINNSFNHKYDSPIHIFFPELSISFSKEEKKREELIENLRLKNSRLLSEVDLLKNADKAKRFTRKIIETQNKSRLITIYGQLIKSDINSIEPYELLGIKLRKNSLFKKALIVFEKALEINKLDAEINREIGFTYRKINDYSNAEKYFKVALELNSEDPELLGMLGGMHKRNGRLTESLDYYLKAYKFESQSLYAVINVATLKFILEGRESGIFYFKEVISICQFEIRENRQNYWTYFCLAQSYLILDKPTELIIENYIKAIEFEPPIEDIRSEFEHIDFLKERNIEKDKINEIQEKVFRIILK